MIEVLRFEFIHRKTVQDWTEWCKEDPEAKKYPPDCVKDMPKLTQDESYWMWCYRELASHRGQDTIAANDVDAWADRRFFTDDDRWRLHYLIRGMEVEYADLDSERNQQAEMEGDGLAQPEPDFYQEMNHDNIQQTVGQDERDCGEYPG